MLEQPNENDGEGADEEIEPTSFTIPSEPPRTDRPQRRSWWADVFTEAREFPEEWRLVVMVFAESTAQQLASDIRNGYKRDPKKMRIRGMAAGERWEARYAPAPSVVSDESAVRKPFWLWLRYVGIQPS